VLVLHVERSMPIAQRSDAEALDLVIPELVVPGELHEGVGLGVAQGQQPIDALVAEAASLQDSGRIVKTRFRLLALLSLVAIPLATVSEGASLYGVAGDHHSTFITVVVTVGLALGGALLVVPLYASWIRLLGPRSWLRGGGHGKAPIDGH
jgi:hypothetical protein